MLIKNLKASGLLSFGPTGIDLPMRDLNVLIGPNGSGKSNLIEVLALLQASPNSLPKPMKEMGGLREWFWKGDTKDSLALIEAVVDNPKGKEPLRHTLMIGRQADRIGVATERIEGENPSPDQRPDYFYSAGKGLPVLKDIREQDDLLPLENIAQDQSILSQVRDPGGRYPAIANLQHAYASIRLFRNWSFGPSSPVRRRQPTDLRSDFLAEEGENLALIISKMLGKEKRELVKNLQELIASVEDIATVVEDNSAMVFLEEGGGKSIPATRLSDGTLRYIGILAILLHPEPPRLVAIEEPELGLHPDLLPHLGKVIKDASERMQIVITTHSQLLLDSFSNSPDDVVVCSRTENGSRFERLDEVKLRSWLEEHTLGELWNLGEIGGTRW